MNKQDIFEVRQTDVEIQEIFDQVPKNKKAIEDINGKFPAEASPENPLADKEYVDGKVGEAIQATNDEATRAKGVEQTLQGGISTEAQTRQQADQTLDGKIAANTQAIAAEKTRAEGAEHTLDGKIAANTQAIADEKTRAEGAEQTLQSNISSEAQTRQQVDTTLDGKIAANTQAIAAEKTRAEGAEATLQDGIDGINGKIPTQASSQNQLADKEFVNSTVATNTANYISNNGQPFTSLAELQAYTGPHDNNDYAFVKTIDAEGNVVYHRYKFDGTQWVLEYTLNNSSFTAAQWAAINSAITSGLVEKLDALPTKAQLDTLFSGKQDTISDLATIRSGAQAGATALQPAALTPYYTKTETDAAIKTESNRAKAAEEAIAGDVADNTENISTNASAIAALQTVVADIETIAEGYVRVAGSSSPELSYRSYKYHEQGGFGRESVFRLFYPCLVGTKLSGDDAQVGTILHVMQKFGARTIDGVPMWLDIYGTPHKIDGSEGDVMIVNVEDFYSINGKHTIEGTEYDVFLMSRTPFTWQGIEAEHMEKFGWAPDYCVSHTDTDNVVRIHSVYNPAWNGSYNAPVGVAGKYVYTTDPETGDIVETYDANETLLGGAGGLHSTGIDLPTGEQHAMNLNADPTKTVPWMNHTAEGCNRLMSLILAEGGTFDAHNAARMGSGFSSNDGATAAGDWEQAGSGAKNGLRIMDKDGAWQYYSLGNDVRFLTGATTGTVYAANVINSLRSPWHIMEAHRAVSYAIENDVHELEWFAFEGNKYKYRSVNGFNGPSHGEMTCVVWKLMATQAGAAAIDPTDLTTSIAGNRVEILVSTALLHGMTTQVSPSWWTSGLIFTEDEDGQYEAYMERGQSQLIISENGSKAVEEQFNFEQHYKHVRTFSNGGGYRSNYANDALMLPDSNADKTGGGLHTYVGAYNYFTSTSVAAGMKSVRGFRRGYGANGANLSPLAMRGNLSPSGAYASIGFGTCCRIR